MAMSNSKADKEGKAISLTHQENKLLDAATDIFSNPPDLAEDMAFTHAIFCQVGLPRSKVDGREFMRQSGAAWVNVQAGYLDEGKGPVQQLSLRCVAAPRLSLMFRPMPFVIRPRRSPSGTAPHSFWI